MSANCETGENLSLQDDYEKRERALGKKHECNKEARKGAVLGKATKAKRGNNV